MCTRNYHITSFCFVCFCFVVQRSSSHTRLFLTHKFLPWYVESVCVWMFVFMLCCWFTWNSSVCGHSFGCSYNVNVRETFLTCLWTTTTRRTMYVCYGKLEFFFRSTSLLFLLIKTINVQKYANSLYKSISTIFNDHKQWTARRAMYCETLMKREILRN